MVTGEETGLFYIISTNDRNFTLIPLFWQDFPYPLLLFPPSSSYSRGLCPFTACPHRVYSAFSITERVEISTGVLKSAADKRKIAPSGAAPPVTCSCSSSSTQKFPSLCLCWVPNQLCVCLCSNSQLRKGNRKNHEKGYLKTIFFSPPKLKPRKMPQWYIVSVISSSCNSAS